MRVVRRGASLVECVMVFGLMSVLLISLTQYLYHVDDRQQQVRLEMDFDQAISRVALAFRADAHRATRAAYRETETDAGWGTLRFDFANEAAVEYGMGRGTLTRIYFQEGVVIRQEPVPMRLDNCAVLLVEQGDHQVVTWSVTRAGSQQPVRFVTVVGLASGPSGAGEGEG